RPTLTTTAGAPVADNQNSITAGPRGPLLLQDYLLIEKLAHQNRERIPERTVHAKGWGAYRSCPHLACRTSRWRSCESPRDAQPEEKLIVAVSPLAETIRLRPGGLPD